jgi:hypothetical protein
MTSRTTVLQLAANKMAEMTHELTIELHLVAFTVAITIVLGSQVPRVGYLKKSFSSFYLGLHFIAVSLSIRKLLDDI